MGSLFCLIGKSSSGKDTIFRHLIEDRALALKPLVTYTTRPRRIHETDGVEYNFITDDTLARLKSTGKIIEMRAYHTVHGVWHYGTVDDGKMNLSAHNYLTIATPEGYGALSKRFGTRVIPIYIDVEDGERLTRALNREKKQAAPDYCELCRRFLADSADFSNERLAQYGITTRFTNMSFDRCMKEVRQYILYTTGS